MAVSSRSGGGRCMPALSRPWKRSPPTGVAEQVERLAHHALRGEVWDKAVTYCRQAGAKAYDRVGVPRGGNLLRAGPRGPRAPPREPRHRRAGHRSPPRLRCAATPGRIWRDVWTLWARPKSWPRRSTIEPGWDRCCPADALYSGRGDHDGAIAAGQRALALAAELGDRVLQVASLPSSGAAILCHWRLRSGSRAAAAERGGAGGGHARYTSYGILSRAWLAWF